MSSLKNILSNKWLLYITAFLSLTSIFGYLMNNDYAPILFFIMVAFLTNYFSKNMILILGISLIATNLLASITNIFDNSTKEGFEFGNKCNGLPQNNCDISGCSWDATNNKCISSANTGANSSLTPAPLDISETINENISISESINKANNLENQYDNLETLVNNDTIKNLSGETSKLLAQQDNLMNQMRDVEPLIKEASNVLNNIGSGNILDMFSSLSGSLNNFYDKYPDSFPKDYPERSKKMNEMMQIANEKKKTFNQLEQTQKAEQQSEKAS